MRFFLDESVNMKVYAGVRALFPAHEFLRCGRNTPKGVNDVPLFPMVADLHCDVFLTSDIRQLDPDRAHERAACRDAGLHWVGVQKVPAKGRRAMTADASVLIGALMHVVDDIEVSTVPRLYLVAHGPRNLIEAVERCENL